MIAQDPQARLNSSRGGRGTHRSWSARAGVVRAAPRHSFRRAAVVVDGAQSVRQERDRFSRQGSDSATVAEKADMGFLVQSGRKDSSGGRWLSRTQARRFAERSTGSCSTSLRQVNGRGTRARDAKRNGALSAGEVEWKADDADSRTAVGRREHGVLSLAQRRALWHAAVAIAGRSGPRAGTASAAASAEAIKEPSPSCRSWPSRAGR